MGSIAQMSASGTGSLSLGGYFQIAEVDTVITTLSTGYGFQGTGVARRLFDIGRWSLGAFSSGDGLTYMTYDRFLHHATEAVYLDQGLLLYSTHIFWSLQGGAVVDFYVYW